MRNSTIIYRSFYESIKDLPKENQAEVWAAIFEFSLNFKTVKLEGISRSLFILIKPQLEANHKRYRSGTEAKRKRKRSEQEANGKQTGSETEANVNVNVNDNGNVNLNVNKNINDMDLLFETFRQMYPGTKRGHDTELETLQKHPDWKTVIYTLPEILEKQIAVRAEKKAKGQFVPEWKNLKTWINQRCWEEEIETPQPTKTEHEGW